MKLNTRQAAQRQAAAADLPQLTCRSVLCWERLRCVLITMSFNVCILNSFRKCWFTGLESKYVLWFLRIGIGYNSEANECSWVINHVMKFLTPPLSCGNPLLSCAYLGSLEGSCWLKRQILLVLNMWRRLNLMNQRNEGVCNTQFK